MVSSSGKRTAVAPLQKYVRLMAAVSSSPVMDKGFVLCPFVSPGVTWLIDRVPAQLAALEGWRPGCELIPCPHKGRKEGKIKRIQFFLRRSSNDPHVPMTSVTTAWQWRFLKAIPSHLKRRKVKA